MPYYNATDHYLNQCWQRPITPSHNLKNADVDFRRKRIVLYGNLSFKRYKLKTETKGKTVWHRFAYVYILAHLYNSTPFHLISSHHLISAHFISCRLISHYDVIKWKHFPRYWPLWGEFTGDRWIPLTKASDAELWCFLWSVPQQTAE